MSSTNRTPHYNLSQFTDTDKPTWRGDVNADMAKIDTALNDMHVSAVQAVGIANAAKEEADAATATADAATDAARTATATADAAKSEAAAAKSEAATAAAKADTIGRHNIVILGDSWTLVESYALLD